MLGHGTLSHSCSTLPPMLYVCVVNRCGKGAQAGQGQPRVANSASIAGYRPSTASRLCRLRPAWGLTACRRKICPMPVSFLAIVVAGTTFSRTAPLPATVPNSLPFRGDSGSRTTHRPYREFCVARGYGCRRRFSPLPLKLWISRWAKYALLAR